MDPQPGGKSPLPRRVHGERESFPTRRTGWLLFLLFLSVARVTVVFSSRYRRFSLRLFVPHCCFRAIANNKRQYSRNCRRQRNETTAFQKRSAPSRKYETSTCLTCIIVANIIIVNNLPFEDKFMWRSKISIRFFYNVTNGNCVS